MNKTALKAILDAVTAEERLGASEVNPRFTKEQVYAMCVRAVNGLVAGKNYTGPMVDTIVEEFGK